MLLSALFEMMESLYLFDSFDGLFVTEGEIVAGGNLFSLQRVLSILFLFSFSLNWIFVMFLSIWNFEL